LAHADEEGGPSGEAASGKPLSGAALREQNKLDADSLRQIAALKKELGPLSDDEDESLLRGARVSVERRLVSAEAPAEGVPAWVWLAVGGGVLAVAVIGGLIVALT
jgi:hypothetical protein